MSLKLHVRTTLLVSAVVVVIFSVVAFFYNRQATGLEQAQYVERAKQLATYYADQMASRWATVPALQQGSSQAELLQGYGFEMSLFQVYIFPVNETFQPGDVTSKVSPRSTSPGRELTAEQIAQLLGRDFPEPEEKVLPDGHFSVWTVAPIIIHNRLQERVVGAVGVQVEVPTSRSLASRMNRLTVISMALVVFIVAIAMYLLFRRLVYQPIDELVCAMRRAEKGDLSATVPIQASDEMGLLAEGFNRMVERLRVHAEERADYARQLEARVREATCELEASNQQLINKNVELFSIQRQLGELERLATAGQLAAQFAHEVGTPLNLISGHVQLLRAKETDERTIKRLETIESQIHRIERIVRGMLDQTRPPRAHLEPTRICSLLERLFDTIAPTLAAHKVTLIEEISEGLPQICADNDQLQQVFINLVNNSLDAMPDGGTLTVSAHLRDGQIVVEVSDTGHGIPEGALPHLFDPLFTTKERGQGSGLGLAVSQQIVREHGGRIEVASTPSAGTTFTVLLPALPECDEAVAPDASVAEVAAEDVQNVP